MTRCLFEFIDRLLKYIWVTKKSAPGWEVRCETRYLIGRRNDLKRFKSRLKTLLKPYYVWLYKYCTTTNNLSNLTALSARLYSLALCNGRSVGSRLRWTLSRSALHSRVCSSSTREIALIFMLEPCTSDENRMNVEWNFKRILQNSRPATCCATGRAVLAERGTEHDKSWRKVTTGHGIYSKFLFFYTYVVRDITKIYEKHLWYIWYDISS